MIVCSTTDQTQIGGQQFLSQRFTVVDDVLCVLFEIGLERFGEANGFSGNDVHQRTALHAGENGRVNFFGPLLFAHDQTSAWTAQSLVRCGGDEVGVGDRAVVNTASNQPRVMGHVDEEQSSVFVSDLFEFGVVDFARISTRSGNNHFRFVLFG